MVSLVSKIPIEGFKATHIKFCASESKIWETSLNASCGSTKSAAVKQKWPPVLTNEGFEPSWVAHARLAAAYCSLYPTEKSCVHLRFESTDKPTDKQEKPASKKSAERGILKLPIWARLLAATIPKVSAAEPCKVENDAILTKSGATIYLDFGAQPGQAHADALTELARLVAQDRLPEVAVKDGVDSILNIGKVLIVNARTKQPWVQARISQDHVTWIGTEFTEQELGDRTGIRLASSFEVLKDQLKSKNVTKAAAWDAMTVGACPTAPACAWLHNANLRVTTSLVPLASDELKQKTLGLDQQETALLGDLAALVTAMKLSKDEFAAIEREYRNLLIAEEPPDTKARNKARNRYSAPEVSKAMVALYDLAISKMKNRSDRDQAVVTAALAQNGNGIFAMGTRARDKMVPMFESACRGPIAAPPVATEKKPAKPAAKASTLK